MAKFSLKKKLLPTAMAAALATGMAFSGAAYAIQVSNDGLGQVLIAPYYQAYPGQSTLITLINTSTTHAAKVKAVFRSKKHCVEQLDFILYMSPGDVWRGKLHHKNDRVYLYSDDDSIRNLPNKDSFAVLEGGVDFPLFQNLETGSDATTADDDINEVGIIEFIGHYTATGTVNVGVGNPVTIQQGMDKFDLARLIDMSVDQITDRNLVECPRTGATFQQGLANTNCPVRINDSNNFKLRGNVEIVTPDGRMAYQMTALTSPPVPVPFTNFTEGTYLIANPYLTITTERETSIGLNWDLDTFFGLPRDNIIDIERAIATVAAIGAYENGITYEGDNGQLRYTGIQVSFPTKYRHRGDVCNSGAAVNTNQGQYFPPFTLNGDVRYQSASFDDFENSRTSLSSVSGGTEVTYRVTECANILLGTDVELFSYEKGFYKFRLEPESTACQQSNGYNGVPAITQTYKYVNNPATGSTSQQMLIPASSDGWQKCN